MSDELIVRQRSCAELTFKAKVEGLSYHIRSKGTAAPHSNPGVCQVCGHNLKVAYRIGDLRKDPIDLIDIPVGDPRVATIEARIKSKHRTDDSWSFAQHTMPFASHACDAISDPVVWKEAKRFNDAITAARANNQPDPAYEAPVGMDEPVEAVASELF
jgi:hypothetical protein